VGNEGARLTVTPLIEGGRRTEKVIVLKVGLRTASGNERSPGDRDVQSRSIFKGFVVQFVNHSCNPV
jgi:hypothetical protein